ISSASRFRWTFGLVGAGISLVRPTGSLAFVGPVVVGLLILVVLAVLAAALVLPRLIAAQLATLRDDTARQLNERNADVDRRLADVTETIDRRLASSNQAATKIHERPREVTKATAEMNERAKDLARLEQALRPPKARGGFGALLRATLPRDRPTPAAFEIQLPV